MLILNDYATGYPIACLESAGISAARTAVSAALAVDVLAGDRPANAGRVAFVGAGVIARTILEHLVAAKTAIGAVSCFDLSPARATDLLAHAASLIDVPTTRAESLDEVFAADVVVFATTAAEPYVPADTELRPGQLLLNISLRDLPPEVLLSSDNVVDDVDHCLKAATSPHLAEQLSGGRDFITGTLGAAMAGRVRLDPARPTVFSPFGLGVLDVAVGVYVLEAARLAGTAVSIPDFFGAT